MNANDRAALEATLPSSTVGKEALFAGRYRAGVLDGCRHFSQPVRPDAVIERVRAHLRANDEA